MFSLFLGVSTGLSAHKHGIIFWEVQCQEYCNDENPQVHNLSYFSYVIKQDLFQMLIHPNHSYQKQEYNFIVFDDKKKDHDNNFSFC